MDEFARQRFIAVGFFIKGYCSVPTPWEYCVIDLTDLPSKLTDIDVLNDAGARGWELVAIVLPLRAILKRPVMKSVQTKSAKATARA